MVIPYTKLKDYNRQSLRDVIPLPKPFTLVIEPSSLCNFKCSQCFQSIMDQTYFSKGKSNMDLACFMKAISDMKQWEGPKLKVLKLSMYGEPLMNRKFSEMLKIAASAGIAERIETTTNASLLDEDSSRRFVEYGLDYMRVSIYSPIEEKHLRLTNSNTKVGQIHQNLLRLKQIKDDLRSSTPFVGVKMLDTYSEENEVFSKLYSDVADEIYLDKPHGWVGYNGKDFLKELYGENLDRALADIAVDRSKRKACSLPFFTLAIRSNGDVSPCCNDWVGGTNIGNINEESLEALWNGDRMYEFRKMQLEGRNSENASCAKCSIYRSTYYMRDDIDGVPIEKLRAQ